MCSLYQAWFTIFDGSDSLFSKCLAKFGIPKLLSTSSTGVVFQVGDSPILATSAWLELISILILDATDPDTLSVCGVLNGLDSLLKVVMIYIFLYDLFQSDVYWSRSHSESFVWVKYLCVSTKSVSGSSKNAHSTLPTEVRSYDTLWYVVVMLTFSCLVSRWLYVCWFNQHHTGSPNDGISYLRSSKDSTTSAQRRSGFLILCDLKIMQWTIHISG